MSCEVTSSQQWPCPYGNNIELMTMYETDWCQTRVSIVIKCPTCKMKYELENKYQLCNGFVEIFIRWFPKYLFLRQWHQP